MRVFKKSATVIVILLMAVFMLEAVAAEGLPKLNTRRFLEDWSNYSADDADCIGSSIKKIDLSDDIWLSIGGQSRLRFESWSAFGFNDANDDDYFLYRQFLHTDLHFGDNWRIFVEGKFSTDFGDRDLPGGSRANLDADEGDFWNTFIEANYDVADMNLTVRLGRQELLYGAQRLVSPLDWSNNRRIFDGGVVSLKKNSWQLDGFVTRPVIGHIHDINENDSDRYFSGLYFAQKLDGGKTGYDLYFLADNIDKTMLDEDRYTIGARGFMPVTAQFKIEGEAAYQFGDTDDDDISAWMVAVDSTYSFANCPWKSWLGLGVDYASGDDDPFDGDSETFKHLFPLGHAYLGYIDVVGRQNIVDLHTTVGAWPIEKKLRLKADLHFFWLAEDEDDLYNAGGGVVRSGGVSEDEVGSEIDLTALYKMNRHTAFLVGYSHFFAGDFIEETGTDDDIDFFYAQAQFTF